MGKKLKNLINYAIIIVVFVFFLVYMLVTEGVENIANAFANLNYGWILVCLLCMLIYWLCECQVLAMFIKRLDRRHRFATIVRVTMIGQLFNCITPFASGGQPIQAYYLCNCIDFKIHYLSKCAYAVFHCGNYFAVSIFY